MEEAARGSGDGSGTDDPGVWGGLNLALAVALVLCLGAIGYCGHLMRQQHAEDGGDTSGGAVQRLWSVATDRRLVEEEGRAGEEVGGRTVTAVPLAPAAEQERVGASLDAAAVMVTAFLSVRFDSVDATIAKVRSLGTGTFLKRYNRSVASIRKAAIARRSIATSKVVWTAYVSGNKDSATVLLAATGTVEDTNVDAPQERTYRVLLRLIHRGDRWLTRDLQFVA